jgi:uncharacterized membrane protein YGL010W
MRKIDRLLAEYGENHQNATNKAIHWICVPLIFLSIMGLIWSIPQGFLAQLADAPLSTFINWATLILVMVLLYYLRLSVSLFFGMLLLVSVFVAITYWVDQSELVQLWLVSLIVFALAWIGQFYGHKIEGKKPSFFKDLQFLLIGPAWLMHFIYKKLKIP